ncbi:F0F1 ATP synthase subunit delta [Ruania halotolerans]|uniref:F0F1 ATP synthase subunit delta n=1 Tax=Ruania halotolerans TaxID=2897773 RepID=UPI001E477944|nr:F0F1 ATP synthase subunit delta [Ruania halotolerans]UFU07654.1 F0F1 ATP synthase subunit delta [Ruania halotolerans]
MRANSQSSTDAARERFDSVLRAAGESADALGTELFAVVDVLDSSATLRRALTDPSREGADKAQVVADVFGGKVSSDVEDLLAGLARARWSADQDIADAVEILGTDALLASAESAGTLLDVETQIFSVIRLLAANRELRLALSDTSRAVQDRTRLLDNVTDGRVAPQTSTLIERALGNRRAPTLTAGLVRLNEAAAARRQQLVATVTAAVPLNEGQLDRLSDILHRAYGRGVQLNVAVEPSVVGGVRIQIGDEVVDATMLSRLDEARRRLAG